MYEIYSQHVRCRQMNWTQTADSLVGEMHTRDKQLDSKGSSSFPGKIIPKHLTWAPKWVLVEDGFLEKHSCRL